VKTIKSPSGRWATAVRVSEYITANPRSSIPQISQGTKLSYTAVRNAIQELLQLGVLKEVKKPREKGKGRPSVRYVVDKPFTIIIPPREYKTLCEWLLEGLLEKYGNKAKKILSAIGENVGKKTVDSWRSEEDGRIPPFSYCLKMFQEKLNNLHSFCEIKANKHDIILSIKNCIFKELTIKYCDLICAFHESYIKSTLKECYNKKLKMTHEKFISKGDEACIFRIILA